MGGEHADSKVECEVEGELQQSGYSYFRGEFSVVLTGSGFGFSLCNNLVEEVRASQTKGAGQGFFEVGAGCRFQNTVGVAQSKLARYQT